MAKEIDKIIQSKTAPKSNNVLWDDGENLKINRNGKWENTGGGTPMINITYANLVKLRNNSKLIAGMQYRITDYVTTTTQENTKSAGHQFDVIVTADNENTLNEVARACLHEGDTYFSEAGANLAAWQIWYSLDNDAERFAWANTENGKGVIYRMIDELENDIPYDFKNVMYIDMTKLKISAEASYYGNWWAGDLVRNPSSDKQVGPNSFYYAWVLINVSGPGSNGVWYTKIDSITSVDTTFYEYDDVGYEFNVSETLRVTNLMVGQMQYTFGNSLAPSSLLSEFIDYTIVGKECYSNTIKEHYNEEKRQMLNIITFGNNCYYNSFGNDCNSNTFGNYCNSNTFGNDCNSNTFGNNCYYNSFGNNCYYNTFGNECNSNTFGNYCNSNSFGNNCCFNTFGNDCYYNSFGNYCCFNSFGNSSQSNELKVYYRYITFGEGVQYVTLQNETEGSFENQVQNYRVANGTHGEDGNPLVVDVTRNMGCEIFIGMDSNDELKVFCLADLLNS